MDAEINAIREVLQSLEMEKLVFVDDFVFTTKEEKKMMQHAMHSIDDSDLLIAEVSDKAIGIGIEVGYAKAKDKPVIYLRNKNAEHSTTVSGISDFQIVYEDVIELTQYLTAALLKIIRDK